MEERFKGREFEGKEKKPVLVIGILTPLATATVCLVPLLRTDYRLPGLFAK